MQIFNVMGNICLEVLAEVPGMELMIRSGGLSTESSIHGSHQGETFTFGNDGLD